MPKNGQIWRVFEKPEASGQTVLPDRSVLSRQKSFKMSKLEILNATF